MSSPAPGAALAPLKGNALLLLTIALSAGTFMEVLDTSIANVAVPTISGNLAVSPSQGTWVISSYSLAAAIAVPLTGWIARRFGEVRVFITSVLLFTLASTLCGLATSLPMLVALRLLQGLVSGPMVPLSQTLLMSSYPPEKRGMAMALWAMTVVVAPIFGPLLGGYITDNMTWPWIFYINLPVGLLSGVVTYTVLKGRDSPTVKQPIDLFGLSLLIVGVASLQIMLDNGNDLDWFGSPVIVGLCVTAVVALTYFVAWELTHQNPIVDLWLLGKRNFRNGVIALAIGFMCFFTLTVLFPLWLQTVMGYTPTWAGIATAPVGILALVFSPLVGKNAHRLDLRMVATVSFVVFAITAYWLSTFTLDTAFNQLMWPRFVQGIAVACFFVPVNQIILSGIAPNKLAAASGLSNFFRTLSASFGTAIGVTLWNHRAQMHSERLAENISTNGVQSLDYLHRLNQGGLHGDRAYAQLQNVLNAQGLMMATSDLFWIISICFLVLISFIWLTKPPFGVAGGGGGGH
jgi:DHA2 family multidrug resistance protein